VMAAEKHPGTGAPLGAGLFCNFSPCLVYLSFPLPKALHSILWKRRERQSSG
jgi:hypothetical protein